MSLISKFKRRGKIKAAEKRVRQSVKDEKRPRIIVYQMGKVASSSIYHALNKRSDCYGFHTHCLTRTKVNDSSSNPNKRGRHSISLAEHIIKPKHPTKIITLVRDPFARNISAFFETNKKAKTPNLDTTQINHLIDEFIQDVNHNQNQDWYDNEFKQALDIDIFAYEFDRERGWSTFKQGPFEVLVLKTNLPDAEKTKQIAQFIGIEDLVIDRINETGAKKSKPCYKQFKETIQFPDEIAQSILKSRFTQHFFTDSEIDNMRKQWL
jgi:hypothetical protein